VENQRHLAHIGELEEKSRELSTELSHERVAGEQLICELDAMEASLRQMSSTNKQLADLVQSVDDDNLHLKQSLEDCQMELSEKETLLREYAAKLSDWDTVEERLRQDMATMYETSRDREAELLESWGENEQLRLEWQGLRSELEQCVSDLETSKSDKESLAARIQQLELEIKENSNGLQAQKPISRQPDDSKAEITRLENALQSVSQMVSRMLSDQSHSTTLSLELINSSTEVVVPQEHNADIVRKLVKLEGDFASTIRERDDLSARLQDMLLALKTQSDALMAADEMMVARDKEKERLRAFCAEAESKAIDVMESRISFERSAVKTIQDLQCRVKDLQVRAEVSTPKKVGDRSLQKGVLRWQDELVGMSLNAHEALTLAFAEEVITSNETLSITADTTRLSSIISRGLRFKLKGLKTISECLRQLHDRLVQAPWTTDQTHVEPIIASHESMALGELHVTLFDDRLNRTSNILFSEFIKGVSIDVHIAARGIRSTERKYPERNENETSFASVDSEFWNLSETSFER
jgi:chromosome segregation ATPase